MKIRRVTKKNVIRSSKKTTGISLRYETLRKKAPISDSKSGSKIPVPRKRLVLGGCNASSNHQPSLWNRLHGLDDEIKILTIANKTKGEKHLGPGGNPPLLSDLLTASWSHGQLIGTMGNFDNTDPIGNNTGGRKLMDKNEVQRLKSKPDG